MLIKSTNTNLRARDLDVLDQARSNAQTTEGKKHRTALVTQVDEYMKDDIIRKLYGELVFVCNQQMERPNDPILWRKLEDLEFKIKGRARNIKKQIATKVQKAAGETEASLFFNKV